MEKERDEVDPPLNERHSLYGIVITEIEMVKNCKWFTYAEKQAKIADLKKLINK